MNLYIYSVNFAMSFNIGDFTEFKDSFVGTQSASLSNLTCDGDKVHTAATLLGSFVSAKQPRLMTDNKESSEAHLVNSDANSVLMSPFDHEHGQVVNNSSSVLNKVATLYENDSLSDIELIICCNDTHVTRRCFAAHKLILCCSSDVLRVMLMNPCWPDSSRPSIELHEEQSCVPVFGDFLRYLYSGRILLTHDTVLPVLMLADKYNVVDLQQVCCVYMCAHLVTVTSRNRSVSWLQYALSVNHESLVGTCRQFILWNFHKVACTSDYLVMDEDVLVDLIQQSDLVIPDELTLFRCLSHWIRHQDCYSVNSGAGRNATHILLHIRFAMIPPSEIGLVTADPIFADYADFFEDRIQHSLDFHASSHPQSLFSGSAYEPRNYTNDIWSTTLSIDSFSSFAAYDVCPVFFSTPATAAKTDSGDAPSWEWTAELFPKGVHFSKFILIGLWRNMEVAGATYDTIRLVIASKSCEPRRTVVVVLIVGVQDGVEYVRHVVKRHCYFDADTQQCQINDIVPFSELNCPNSPYLSGSDGNTFRILIVIKPE